MKFYSGTSLVCNENNTATKPYCRMNQTILLKVVFNANNCDYFPICILSSLCFYLCLNDNVQSRFYVHLKLVGHVSHFSVVYLFVWLLTSGYWNGLARRRYCVISCCQGLAKLACVEAVFPNTICYGLLAVEVFPNCVYVRTVGSGITVFTMYVLCCIFAIVFQGIPTLKVQTVAL